MEYTLEELEKYELNKFKESFKNIILEIVKDWKVISKSPYSMSLYNSSDIGWGYKPEGSYRISNHWSFTSQGEIHCKLEDGNEDLKNEWLLGEYKNGKYKILKNISKEWDEICGRI